MRSQRDNVVVLRVRGDLDLCYAPRLAVEAAQEIRTGHDLIIDIAGVTFMDSAGMAMLLNASRRATRAGAGFAVVCPGGAAYRSIQAARLMDALNVCADHPSAMARLATPATRPTTAQTAVGGLDARHAGLVQR